MKTRRLVAAALAGLILTGAPASFAQSAADVAAARDLFVDGSEAAQEGRWDEARELYARSLKLKRAPITLYSLGIAQKNTGLFVEALENLRAFLAEPSSPATEPYEQPAREAVEELEKRVGWIELRVSPSDAPGLRVEVDGVEVPEAARDRPRLVNPGAHEVTASAEGFRESRVELTVPEGGEVRAALKLEPLPAPARPEPPPRRTPAVARALPPAPPDRAEPPAPSRALPIALIGGGAAVFAAGGVVGLLGVSQASSAPTRDGSEASAARTKMIVGDALGAVGLVSAGIGVALLLFPPGASSKGTSARRPAAGLRVAAPGVLVW